METGHAHDVLESTIVYHSKHARFMDPVTGRSTGLWKNLRLTNQILSLSLALQ